MLWPLLALMVRLVPSILSTVPRILTGGLAGAWATATADTAASSNAAMVRIMGTPFRVNDKAQTREARSLFQLYWRRERRPVEYNSGFLPQHFATIWRWRDLESFIERRFRDSSCPYPCARLLCLAGIGSAAALDYPARPVKWVVPYPPGGTTDVLARIVSQWLSDKMGQPFLIENKAGGGNNIGVESVVHAAPDGYTMLLVNPANGINTPLYKNLPFDFIRDIAPVAGLVGTPNVMEVTHSFPAKTVAEFIAYCKANPGKINMASSGSGTSVHLSGELFKTMTGCDMLHV